MRALVVRGGPDAEREVSLVSGAAVVDALRSEGHEVADEAIGQIGIDDLRGLIEKHRSDVVWGVLHGGWGEGGAFQSMLEEIGVAFVGSGSAAARLAMDKVAGKAVAQQVIDGDRVRIADHVELHAAREIGDELVMELPVVVKPTGEGSSVGAHVCRDVGAYRSAIADARARGGRWMVERAIAGREVTVGLIDRWEGLEVLPIVEVVATDWFDYEAKYESERTRFEVGAHVDASFGDGVVGQLGDASLAIAQTMGVRDLGRADFMVEEDGTAWFLELNTMPGFTDKSLLPLAARSAGIGFGELCSGLVDRAVARWR